MKVSAKFKTEAAQKNLCGYDGEFMESPCRQEEMDVSLLQRADGTFYLHRLIFDDDGEPCGNVKRDLSPAQAAAWWTENFIPPALRPFLTK